MSEHDSDNSEKRRNENSTTKGSTNGESPIIPVIVSDPDEIRQHPAVIAWTGVNGKQPLPSKIELLKRKDRNRLVFRLSDAEASNRPIIAKRCHRTTGAIENKIYEQILPDLKLSSPRYYGLFVEDEENCWLFLEDVGENPYLHDNLEHRDAAAQWLGRLHSRGVPLNNSFELEGRGTEHYFNHLQAGRMRIFENMDNPTLSEEDCSFLLEVIDTLESIASYWPEISSACDDMPNTVVHCDFRPKNMFVRHEGKDVIVYPIDWEMAGWGLPAPDLAPSDERYSDGLINLEVYRQCIRDEWPGLTMQDFDRILAIGYLFRRLAATDWATMSLRFQPPELALLLLDIYLKDLDLALHEKPWEC